MRKNNGLLVIDQQRHTVLIPADSANGIFDALNDELIKTVKRHATFKDLDADVHAYCRDEYEEGKEN